MPKFFDSDNREWTIKITSWEVRLVRERVGILLTNLMEEKAQLLADLFSDTVLLVDVLWAILEEDATKREITLRQFAMSLAGDSVLVARIALVEGIIDFFDDPETRAGVRDVLRKMLQIGERMRSDSVATIRQLDPDLVAKSIMSSVLNTPVFAASNPGNTPSANSK